MARVTGERKAHHIPGARLSPALACLGPGLKLPSNEAGKCGVKADVKATREDTTCGRRKVACYFECDATGRRPLPNLAQRDCIYLTHGSIRCREYACVGARFRVAGRRPCLGSKEPRFLLQHTTCVI